MQIQKVGILFILFTTNNMLCSITDFRGNVLSIVSAGSLRTKGLKKSISSTIYTAILELIQDIKKMNFVYIHIKVKGVNKSKKLILRTLNNVDLKVLSLQDLTSFPHNGCRRARKRRI